MDSGSSRNTVKEARVEDAAGLKASVASGTSESEDEDVNSSSENAAVPASPDSTAMSNSQQRQPQMYVEADGSMIEDSDELEAMGDEEDEDEEQNHSGNLEESIVVKEIDAVMECDDSIAENQSLNATKDPTMVKEGDKNQNIEPSLSISTVGQKK